MNTWTPTAVLLLTDTSDKFAATLQRHGVRHSELNGALKVGKLSHKWFLGVQHTVARVLVHVLLQSWDHVSKP